MDVVAVQLATSILSSDLVKETVFSAARLIRSHGIKLSEKMKEYMAKAERDEIPDGEEAPLEVQAEVKGTLKEILKKTSELVYADGVALFCEQDLSKENQEDLALFFTCTNDDQEIEFELSDREEKYLNIVREFLLEYYGTYVSSEEKDFIIEDDVIFLNFGFNRPEDYFRVYEPDDMRLLADALNQLLGDKYITRFTIF